MERPGRDFERAPLRAGWPQGNHGEDVKECYFYLDNTPTHSYLKALYKYPQAAFPYEQLVAENGRRTRNDPEYELTDTGVFAEDRYFDVTVEYAKSSPEDILIRITAMNRGPEPAPLHILPTVWFRNRWAWSGGDGARPAPQRGWADRTRRASLREAMASCGRQPVTPVHRQRVEPGGIVVLRESIAVHEGCVRSIPRPGRHGCGRSLADRHESLRGVRADARPRRDRSNRSPPVRHARLRRRAPSTRSLRRASARLTNFMRR